MKPALLRSIVLFLVAGLLISCAGTQVKLTDSFDLSGRDYLYNKTDWSFSGRIAVSDKKDSFSASIDWSHSGERDEIKLAGPLGQGSTRIIITKLDVVIDYGDRRVQYFGDVDDVVSRQLGVLVPVSALRYWVRGLVRPKTEYDLIDNGFLQSNWAVEYRQMQLVGANELPRKIRIEQSAAKLKLIIDVWQI